VPNEWPVRTRVLLAASVGYACCAAAVSYAFTRWTGLSRWTMTPAGPALAYYNLLGVNLAIWCGWALMAVLVFRLGRRFPLGRGHWLLSLAVHLPMSVLVTTAHIVLVVVVRVGLQRAWGLSPDLGASLFEAFFRTIDTALPVYWALLGLQHAVDSHREARTREVATAQLETKLLEARLAGLQRQIHPHFLFNTLHAISALVHRDPHTADTMIERLSDMLRVTLSTTGIQQVPLARELEFLQTYLEIEQMHLGARLHVELAIEADVLDVLVPTYLLQPLVENAIRHGLAPRRDGGTVRIEARASGPQVVITITDDGIGLRPAHATPRPGHGVGLQNTRARLSGLYAGAAALEVTGRDGGGTVVRVTLPMGRALEREPEALAS
jgi:signal transduction histidine kinase